MFVASSESLGYSRGGSGKPSCRAPRFVGMTKCVCGGGRRGTVRVSMCLCLHWLVYLCVSVVLSAGERETERMVIYESGSY